MRRLCLYLILLALFALVPALAIAETRIMVVSDIHYLAPSLYEGSGLFLRSMAVGDGKMTMESPALVQALLAEARHQAPDVLLITGDLTFNGEKTSHEELAAAMDILWDEGIPVYVIPGNHDINNPNARAFIGDTYEAVPSVTPGEFHAVWDRCMLPAESVGDMSYTLRLNDEVWIAMTDVCVYEPAPEVYGFYSEDQQSWLLPMLAEARQAGVTVICATHQSLIPRTSNKSYSIFNREYMLADLRSGGVTLNLSGHIHIQSVMEQDGFTDACTGAFSVYSHNYGIVMVGEDGVPRYERHAVCDEHLPEGFRERSAAAFDANTRRSAEEQLRRLEIPEADRAAMVEFQVRLNRENFAGLLDPSDPVWQDDPALQLWRTYTAETSTGARILRMLGIEE